MAKYPFVTSGTVFPGASMVTPAQRQQALYRGLLGLGAGLQNQGRLVAGIQGLNSLPGRGQAYEKFAQAQQGYMDRARQQAVQRQQLGMQQAAARRQAQMHPHQKNLTQAQAAYYGAKAQSPQGVPSSVREIQQLQQILATMPKNDPRRAAYEDRLKKVTNISPQVQMNVPKPVADTIQMANKIKALRATGDPNDARMADMLEVQLRYGKGGPSAAESKKLSAIGGIRESLGGMWSLMAGGHKVTSPTDRANMAQHYARAVMNYANFADRGANFTDMERELVDSVIGGDPNSLAQRLMQSDAAYMARFQKAAALIEKDLQRMLDARIKLPSATHRYPWQPPKGVTQQQWNVMTPTQRAKF